MRKSQAGLGKRCRTVHKPTNLTGSACQRAPKPWVPPTPESEDSSKAYCKALTPRLLEGAGESLMTTQDQQQNQKVHRMSAERNNNNKINK